MLNIHSFIFGPFQENTYIVHDESGQGVIIDPGCYQQIEEEALRKYIQSHNIVITQIINTHCHIDHVLGNEFAKKNFDAPLYIPKGEDAVFQAVRVYAPDYGFPNYVEAEVDGYLSENDNLVTGNSSWEILHVPGHSPGHLAFYQPDYKFCIGGDVLFNGSIGRTDLPGGDYETLIESIHNKIFALEDEVVVYSGHGPTTTVGQEKKTNPFCAII